ncbi:MAG: hypothetical protein R2729_09585 [Bryobacteraceae bacterium]
MTFTHLFVSGVLAGAAILALSPAAHAQERPAPPNVVYGRCAVEATGWRDNFGECRLTGSENGKVPEGKTLRIDHVSASCAGPVEHQVTILALGTQLKPDEDMGTQIVIPVTRRELVTQGRSIYQASIATRLYAGSETKLEIYMGLEIGFLPTTGASCGVTFHGVLLPR